MTKINSSNSVMLLATKFADKGDWTVEQQFVLQMGSSYLLAHGLGSPLAKDAVTTFNIEEEGDYNLLVRTKNWTAFWSEGKTPGVFQVKVDGQTDAAEFGLGCEGATRAERAAWYWQKGGKYTFSKGKHTVALHDLAGFDGRCDAIILTQTDCVPGDSLEEYFELRKALLGDNQPEDKGSFDFVVDRYEEVPTAVAQKIIAEAKEEE